MLSELSKRGFKALAEEDKDYIVETIKDFQNMIYNKYGFQSFIFYGTLLGAVREKDFIANDNDIDIMIFIPEDDKTKVLKQLVSLANHFAEENTMRFIKSKWMCNGYPLGQMMVQYKGVQIDLTVGWGQKRFMTWKWSENLGRVKDLWPLKGVPFRNTFFFVPQNSEYLLHKTYGDWTKPREEKAWDYQKDMWYLLKTARRMPHNNNIKWEVKEV